METYSKSLLAELDQQLEMLHSNSTTPLQYAVQAIEILIPILKKLKAFISSYCFKDTQEEILFFKTVKPKFIYRLIYYNELYILESNRRYCGSKFDRDYLKCEVGKIKDYIDANFEFHRYIRTGNSSNDESYFLRGKPNLSFAIDSFYFDSDHEFSTSHDYKVARFMANDLLYLYLHEQLAVSKTNHNSGFQTSKKVVRWTGPKAHFIELVYALHTCGMFNNGNIELKTLVISLSNAFEIEAGQFNRTFLELRSRKSDRTKFLSILAQQLTKRMDDADD